MVPPAGGNYVFFQCGMFCCHLSQPSLLLNPLPPPPSTFLLFFSFSLFLFVSPPPPGLFFFLLSIILSHIKRHTHAHLPLPKADTGDFEATLLAQHPAEGTLCLRASITCSVLDWLRVCSQWLRREWKLCYSIIRLFVFILYIL